MTPNDEHTSLVPASGASGNTGGPSAWALGCVGVAVGVGIVSWYPLLGAMLVGAATRALLERSGAKAGIAVALAAAVGFAVVAVMQQPLSALVAAPTVLLAVALAALMYARRAGVTEVSLAMAAVVVLSLAVDALSVGLQGSDIATVMSGYLLDAVRASAGVGVEATMMVQMLEPVVVHLWPLSYVLNTAINALFAAIGSRAAVARAGVQPIRISAFDAPVWSVGVLAVSVVGLGASMANIPAADTVLTVSLTVCMSVRFIFMLQGFGVLFAKLEQHRVGCFARTAVILFAVWIETMLFILSIVGLVDVWANFRRLPRDGSPDQAHR